MSTENESRSRLSAFCVERDQEQQSWDEDGVQRNRELDAAKQFRADYQKASQSMFSLDVDWSDVRSGVKLAEEYEKKWREAQEAHMVEMTRLNTEISTPCATLNLDPDNIPESIKSPQPSRPGPRTWDPSSGRSLFDDLRPTFPGTQSTRKKR